MPIVNTDIQYRLSGGAANADPDASLGGAMSSVAASSNIFDNVASAEASAGDIEYRCVYVRNNHGSLTLQSAKVWVQSNTPSTDTSVDIALEDGAVDATAQGPVADENTAPAAPALSFVPAATEGAALSIGDIPFGQKKAIWFRRTVNSSAAAYTNDGFTIRVKGDTAA